MLNKIYFDKWDYAYIDVAERFSLLSSANRLKVGAIAVKDNRVIGLSYNGMPSGCSNVCEDENGKTKPEVLHAEQNLLCALAKSTESGSGATLYITHEPCSECAKQIYMSGISRVVYKHEYESSHGSGLEFLKQRGLRVDKI